MDRKKYRLDFFNNKEGFEQLEKEAYTLEQQRRNAILFQGKVINASLAAQITIQALDDILDLHGLPVAEFRLQNIALLIGSLSKFVN